MEEGDAITVVWNDGGGLKHVWVCMHPCRGYGGALGGIVKRTIGVKLG